MIRFRRFLTETIQLAEDRIDFVKKQNPKIDSSHDTLAKHRKPSDIVDHFAQHADPSPKKHYTQWIVNRYRNKDFRQEDAPRVKDALTSFDQNKRHMPEEGRDINKYKSLNHLEDSLPKVPQHSEKEQNLLGKDVKGAELVHSEPGMIVHKLKTHEGARALGAGTKWCTSGKEPHMFNSYNKQGPMYVVHADKDKYQFHFASNQFADPQDKMHPVEDLIAEHPKLQNVPAFKKESMKFMTPHERENIKDPGSLSQNDRIELAKDQHHAEKLVDHPDEWTRAAVARHHPDAAQLMDKDPSPVVKHARAQHFPYEAPHNLFQKPDLYGESPDHDQQYNPHNYDDPHEGMADDDEEEFGDVARGNYADEEDMGSLAEHRADLVRKNSGAQKHFMNDPDKDVRSTIGAVNKKLASKMTGDPDAEVRRQIAYSHADIGRQHLMNDPNPFVRQAVVQSNPEIADKYVNDPHSEVRATVARSKDLAQHLVDDPSEDVRSQVASHHELAHHFLNDPHNMVRSAVARHPDLAHAFISDPHSEVRYQVAKHAHLADYLTSDPDKDVKRMADLTVHHAADDAKRAAIRKM